MDSPNASSAAPLPARAAPGALGRRGEPFGREARTSGAWRETGLSRPWSVATAVWLQGSAQRPEGAQATPQNPKWPCEQERRKAPSDLTLRPLAIGLRS